MLSCHCCHNDHVAVDVVIVWSLGGGGNVLGLAPLLSNNMFCCRMVSHFCSSQLDNTTDLMVSCHCCHYHHVAVDVVVVWGLGGGGNVLNLAPLLSNNMFCCRMVSHFCSSPPEITADLLLSCHCGHYHPVAVVAVIVWGLGGGRNVPGLAPLLWNIILWTRICLMCCC